MLSMAGKLEDADTTGGFGCHFGGKICRFSPGAITILEPLPNGEIFDGQPAAAVAFSVEKYAILAG